MVREGDETIPYMRTNPHFISFQDFVRCDVYDELQRQEQDVDNTVVGSGFAITKIIFLDIHILKSDPLQASSYIDLPKEIKLKKAVVNIQNKDKCFLWSVLAYLQPPQWNPERVEHYKKYENTLNVKDLKFPMSLRDIPKFEKMNNLSVNVYGLTDTNKVQILKISNNYKNDQTHIDLLHFTLKEKSHYAFIKNLSRLTKSQLYKRKCIIYQLMYMD